MDASAVDASSPVAGVSSSAAEASRKRGFGFTGDLSDQINAVFRPNSFVLVTGRREGGADDVIHALLEKQGSGHSRKYYENVQKKFEIENVMNSSGANIFYNTESIDAESQMIIYDFYMGSHEKAKCLSIFHCECMENLEKSPVISPLFLSMLAAQRIHVPRLHARHGALKALVNLCLETSRPHHSFAPEVFALLEELKWPSTKDELQQLVRSVISGPPAPDGVYTVQAVARTMVASRMGPKTSGRYSIPSLSCTHRFWALVGDVNLVAHLLGSMSTTIQMQLKKPRR